MHVVGGGDDDRVDVVTAEDGIEVGGGKLGPVARLEVTCARLVDVHGGHEPDLRNLCERVGVAVRDSATASHGHAKSPITHTHLLVAGLPPHGVVASAVGVTCPDRGARTPRSGTRGGCWLK